MKCRFCNSKLEEPFLDLGQHPSANRLLSRKALAQINDKSLCEPKAPLRLLVCRNCWLVQLTDFKQPEALFTDSYLYYSSYAQSWVDHAKRYTDMAVERFSLSSNSWVVEIASNDGYLLQHFVELGIPCIGVDPAAEAAKDAKGRGVNTLVEFFSFDFSKNLVELKGNADLVLGNNVLAHVPNINDFIAGLGYLIKPTGIITMEFPHLAKLITLTQFDTVYDEHYFYFSLLTICKIFAHHGLRIFDVEELSTHGGSLRIFAQHAHHNSQPTNLSVERTLTMERELGLNDRKIYEQLQHNTAKIRNDFKALIDHTRKYGGGISAFGAAAKGNTFLNYCGVNHEQITLVADNSPAKQGRFLPGSHIPIVAEHELREMRPDLVLILPWNLREEIARRLSYVREWGGKFITCIPQVEIW